MLKYKKKREMIGHRKLQNKEDMTNTDTFADYLEVKQEMYPEFNDVRQEMIEIQRQYELKGQIEIRDYLMWVPREIQIKVLRLMN